MSFLEKFFRSREGELQFARREGVLEAHRSPVSELSYLIGTRQLLRQAPHVPEKWVTAFELLLPGTDAEALSEMDVKHGLVKLGFRDNDAQALLNQRKRPEALVMQLLAVMSGIPDEKTWGLVRSD